MPQGARDLENRYYVDGVLIVIDGEGAKESVIGHGWGAVVVIVTSQSPGALRSTHRGFPLRSDGSEASGVEVISAEKVGGPPLLEVMGIGCSIDPRDGRQWIITSKIRPTKLEVSGMR